MLAVIHTLIHQLISKILYSSFFFFFKFIVVCEVEIFSLIQSSGIFVHFDGRSLPHWLFTAVFDLYAIPDAKNDGTILDTSLSIFSTQIRNRAIRVMYSNGIA